VLRAHACVPYRDAIICRLRVLGGRADFGDIESDGRDSSAQIGHTRTRRRHVDEAARVVGVSAVAVAVGCSRCACSRVCECDDEREEGSRDGQQQQQRPEYWTAGWTDGSRALVYGLPGADQQTRTTGEEQGGKSRTATNMDKGTVQCSAA